MAGVAQLVERQIVALEVASSKLVARPIFFIRERDGVSPSGKARDFDSRIRRFKSCHPSQNKTADKAKRLRLFVGSSATPAKKRPISSVGRALDF